MIERITPWLPRAWWVSAALGAAVLLAAPAARAQEEGDKADPAQSMERAQEAVREAFERIWVPRHRLTNGPHVLAAFRDVVAEPSKATVEVRAEGKTLAMGGIVGPDGWVLTKSSVLAGRLTVLLKDKRELDARVVGVDRDNDLAMLKVDAKNLPSLQLSEGIDAESGAWVATPGPQRDPVAIGVVSVAPRKIPRRSPGVLGIQMEDSADDDTPGAKIVKVFDDTGAAKAGVLVNDIVVRINEQTIKDRNDLRSEVQRYNPGDRIEVELLRGEERLTLTIMLTGRVQEMFPPSRSQYQNSLGSVLSQRRSDFPSALQHDTVIEPKECGGPLVDLDGRVVGFNIARAGRTESFAIPTSTILSLMYDLMSGKQPPGEEG